MVKAQLFVTKMRNSMTKMTGISDLILGELKRDGRASVSDLASRLGTSRATVRSHLDRMTNDGTILGFTVVLGKAPDRLPVKGVISIALSGGTIERVVGKTSILPAVTQVHTTHGTWDLVLHFAVDDLGALDALLADIREIEGVIRSETSVFLRQRAG